MRRLRGHHLICLHFFEGEGYDAFFVNNLENVLEDVTKNGGRVVDGADDVCHACPHLKEGMCSYKEGEEKIRRLDDLALRLLELQVGEVFEWGSLEDRLGTVFPAWAQAACGKCDWREVCENSEKWREMTP